jgi:hypothetical protein
MILEISTQFITKSYAENVETFDTLTLPFLQIVLFILIFLIFGLAHN